MHFEKIDEISGKVKFLATFYDSNSGTPAEASVFISGTKYTLTLDLGKASLGTYIYETTTATACREYYFFFRDSAGYFHVLEPNLNCFLETLITILKPEVFKLIM